MLDKLQRTTSCIPNLDRVSLVLSAPLNSRFYIDVSFIQHRAAY